MLAVREMSRLVAAVAAIASAPGFAAAQGDVARWQIRNNTGIIGPNLDRMVPLSGGPYTLCERICRGVPGCRGFTYTRPEYSGGQGWCRLKSRVDRLTSHPCCIAGIAVAPSHPASGCFDPQGRPRASLDVVGGGGYIWSVYVNGRGIGTVPSNTVRRYYYVMPPGRNTVRVITNPDQRVRTYTVLVTNKGAETCRSIYRITVGPY